MAQEAGKEPPALAEWWHHRVAATLFSELPEQPKDAQIVAELLLQMVAQAMAKLAIAA